MNSKERVLATLRGEPRDRMPFWPKLTPSALPFYEQPFCGMSIPEIHRHMGTDMLGYTAVPIDNVSDEAFAEKRREGRQIITLYHIGNRTLVGRELVPETHGDSHPVEYPLKTIQDVRLMMEYYAHSEYRVDEAALSREAARMDAQSDLFFFNSLPATPLMELCQYLIGLENTIYWLYDYENDMRALMEVMHADMLKRLQLTCEHARADYLLNTENTSTTMISPALFEEYCMPHLHDCGHLMARYGKKQVLHMCGKLKALLPAIARLPAVAMEAFSSPTVGDTTIDDGYRMLPGKVIIGGTCAVTWLNTPERIAEQVLWDIRQAGNADRLILSSGGVMPFSASPDIIKRAWDYIRSAQ